MTMRLSCTITKIRGLKHLGVATLTFWGSSDVIGHVTIRLVVFIEQFKQGT